MLRDFIDLTDFCNFVINDRRPERINCRSSEQTPRVSAVVSYANDIVNVASIQLNIPSFHQSIRNARLEKITPAFHAINLFFPLFSFCFSPFYGKKMFARAKWTAIKQLLDSRNTIAIAIVMFYAIRDPNVNVAENENILS